jgi:hypothetical protein
VQPGRLGHGQPGVGGIAPGELIALGGGGQVLQDHHNIRGARRDRRVVAARPADAHRRGEIPVEADLILIRVRRDPGRAAGLLRGGELHHDRGRA